MSAVLEDTVRRDGQRLRLTARRVDGRTGYQLWSGDFDRELGDGFAMEAELAQQYLDKWRAERPSDPGTRWLWTDLAALAASEGHRDEAVELLRIDMNANKVAPLFRPNLPWFRSLEGHPGYDALVREKTERLAKYRIEMMAVEAGFGISP